MTPIRKLGNRMVEAERLARVRELGLLDTPPEERFDAIVRTITRIFRVPIAFLALVGEEQVFLKAREGLPIDLIPRQGSFCNATISAEGDLSAPMVIEDASQDPQFANHPWVSGAPFVRFYASIPLTGVSEQRIGCLGLMDLKPRQFSDAELQSLRDMASWSNRELGINAPPKKPPTPVPASTRHIDSEVRMRAVLTNARDGILTLDMAGRIESCNPAAEQIFLRRADHVIGTNIMSLLDLSALMDRSEQERGSIGSLSLNTLINGEVTGRRGDGSAFPMEISLSKMFVQERQMFTAIIRDITERKKIETMKEEFISVVSHELRTPLTSICGSLGLLSGGVLGELPEKALSVLDIAYQNSQRLVRLINDILDIEKISSGQMEFQLKALSLRPLLEQTIASNEGYAGQHNTRFVLMECPPDAIVMVDQDRLVQVITNLLSNAAKFSPEDTDVQISVMQHDSFHRVSVIDHGPGIPDEFRDRIFTKFAQADSSSTRRKGGTGLGLSICKELIEHMGGHIGFAPTPGGGTTFFFDLPQVTP